MIEVTFENIDRIDVKKKDDGTNCDNNDDDGID